MKNVFIITVGIFATWGVFGVFFLLEAYAVASTQSTAPTRIERGNL